jgi:hypothetical protein
VCAACGAAQAYTPDTGTWGMMPRISCSGRNPLIRPLLGCHREEQQAQVAALHLLRRRTGRHRMLQILPHPPSKAILSPRALRHERPCMLSCSVLGHVPPPFPHICMPSAAQNTLRKGSFVE